MHKMIPTALVAVAASMLLSASPAQAEAPMNAVAAKGSRVEPNPIGGLLQMGPLGLPEGLFHLVPTE
ncbi:hypothetical protein ACF073_11630 [Streptomyces sp. NPDC015171]|jgi:hypothetical protein|uniref:hypothetical protein n=1 Tax=Streptomyces sp. NPDC015171 TaxID=3364945 RepID=UPI0036F930A2